MLKKVQLFLKVKMVKIMLIRNEDATCMEIKYYTYEDIQKEGKVDEEVDENEGEFERVLER